jgi:hypothetical protein
MTKLVLWLVAAAACSVALPSVAVAQAPPPAFDVSAGAPVVTDAPPPAAVPDAPIVTPPAGPPSNGEPPADVPRPRVRWGIKIYRHFVQLTVGCIQDAWNIGKLRLYWRGKLLGKGQPVCGRNNRARAEIVLRTVVSDKPLIFSSDVTRRMKRGRHMRLRVATRIDGVEYTRTLRLRYGRILNPVIATPTSTFPGLTYYDRASANGVACVGCWWYYFWSWLPSHQTWIMRVQQAATNDNLGIFRGGYYIEWANHFWVYVWSGTGWLGAYGPYSEAAWPG